MNVSKLLQWAGAIAVPLLVAALGLLASAVSSVSAHGARDAVIERRVSALEKLVERQTVLVQKQADTVNAMHIDQAKFIGATGARLTSLEAGLP